MTPADLAALLARHHPALAGGHVEPLGQGDFCTAFAVDGAWAVRVARHVEAAAALAREASFLPVIAPRLPLSIPEPVLAFAGDGADPAFAVHRILPGPVLTRERFEALPEPARDHCAAQVGGFLAALHGIDPAGLGLPALDLRARAAGLLAEAAGAPLPERDFAEAVLRACASDHVGAPVLLHGDLSPDHVLCDTRAVTGIIDFGDAAVGEAAWDFVYLYEDYGPDFLARALRAYPCADPRALLARAQRLVELDAVQWALRCDAEERPEAAAYLRRLRAEAHAPPWST